MPTRNDIVRAARDWTGTPYQHQASVKGAGTDCLGLIRGIWREFYGPEPLNMPPYTMDWGERSKEESLLRAANKCLTPIKRISARPGDVLLFRMRPDGPCKHIAIMSSGVQMIHAYWGHAVRETHIVPYWQKRWVHSFAFPDMPQLSPARPQPKNLSFPHVIMDDTYKAFPARSFRPRAYPRAYL